MANRSNWVGTGAWLVFLPNASYLVTDLGHWRPRDPVPLWFDGLLLFHFAWLGLALGFAALRSMHSSVRRAFGGGVGWGFALTALLFASFGIYLGRYQRWNSWDVPTNPWELWTDIAARVCNPVAHPRAWGFTLMFALFLALAYVDRTGRTS